MQALQVQPGGQARFPETAPDPVQHSSREQRHGAATAHRQGVGCPARRAAGRAWDRGGTCTRLEECDAGSLLLQLRLRSLEAAAQLRHEGRLLTGRLRHRVSICGRAALRLQRSLPGAHRDTVLEAVGEARLVGHVIVVAPVQALVPRLPPSAPASACSAEGRPKGSPSSAASPPSAPPGLGPIAAKAAQEALLRGAPEAEGGFS